MILQFRFEYSGPTKEIKGLIGPSATIKSFAFSNSSKSANKNFSDCVSFIFSMKIYSGQSSNRRLPSSEPITYYSAANAKCGKEAGHQISVTGFFDWLRNFPINLCALWQRKFLHQKFTLNYSYMPKCSFHHQKSLKMAPGDLVCFNNRRILHGRKSLNLNGGVRHLKVCLMIQWICAVKCLYTD